MRGSVSLFLWRLAEEETSWSVYGKLYQDNLTFLRGMLEQAAQPNEERNAVTQKIGDFYAACMDEGAVEKRGLSAIQPGHVGL